MQKAGEQNAIPDVGIQQSKLEKTWNNIYETKLLKSQ